MLRTSAREISFGALRAGDQHRADDEVGGRDLLLDVGAVRHHGGDVAAEDVVDVAEPRRIDVEDR